MRYLDIICESIPSSPEFLAWFKGSKVVDKNGQPLRMFHGTKAKFELPFQSFTHFGTSTASNTLLYGKLFPFMSDYKNHNAFAKNSTSIHYNNARVYPVFLSIKKPYIYTDFRNNGYADILRKMLKDNIITRDDVEELRAVPSFGAPLPGWGNANFLHRECGDFIIKTLTQLGYDGLRYKNKWEDLNSYSWVVFSPDQVWHEFQ